MPTLLRRSQAGRHRLRTLRYEPIRSTPRPAPVRRPKTPVSYLCPNNWSSQSFLPDLTVKPGKFGSRTGYVCAYAALVQFKAVRDLFIRQALLFQYQAAAKRLFHFIQSPIDLADPCTFFVVDLDRPFE